MMRLKLLVLALAIAVVTSPAEAQTRGRSGLPAGPGNPISALKNALAGSAKPQHLAVYDGVDQKVGDVVGVLDMSVPVVALNVDGRQFVLKVTATHLYGVRVVFEAQGCTGTPLLVMPFLDTPNAVQTTLSLAGVAGPGHTVYLAAPDAVGQFVPYRSRLTLDGTCISSAFTTPATVFPAVQHVDLDTLFSSPFSVR